MPTDCKICRDTLRCMVCGAKFRHAGVLAHCNGGPPRPGLGDMVSAGLASIGITKERVEALVGSPCGCPERQALINAAGAKWLGLPPGSTARPDVDPPT